MFCENCGNKIEDGSKFCAVCGAEVTEISEEQQTEQVQTAPTEVPPADVEAIKSEPETKKKEKSRKKFPVGLVVAIAVAIAIISAVTVLLFKTFPLTVSVKDPYTTSTTTGIIHDFSMSFEANQPIKSVKYALEPKDPDNLELYTEAELEGGMFNKTMNVESFKVLPGDVTLYIQVETWFGNFKYELELSCRVGYATAPELNAITTLQDGTSVVGNELIVCFNDGVSSAEAKKAVETSGGKVVGAVYAFNQYQVRYQDSNISDLAGKMVTLKNNEKIRAVFYNVVYSKDPLTTPNDGNYDGWDGNVPAGNNWHHECINSIGAWDYNDKMSTVKVGVLDSVLQFNHEDIEVDPGKICYIPTEDFTTMSSVLNYLKESKTAHVCIDRTDCDFCAHSMHGTHVSGIIGALANNGKGVCGVNWKSDIYFSNAWYYYKEPGNQLRAESTWFNMQYSIAYLVMSECKVINMSIGSIESSEQDEGEIEEAEQFEYNIKRLEDAGYDFLLVKAAGNHNDDASNYRINRVMTYGERAKAHTIIVGSLEHHEIPATQNNAAMTLYSVSSFSNYGDLVDILAPGSAVYSTVLGDYTYASGTSMASPVVAGVASLVYSVNPDITYDAVKSILISRVEKYSAKRGTVYPVVNAKLAVEYALNTETTVPETTEPTVGFVTGIVKDAATENIITNAVVELVNNETNEVSLAALLGTGEYYIYADAGNYTMHFKAEGYYDETVYNVEVTNGVVKYNVLLNLIPESESETEPQGTAQGRVVDAFDASSIANADISVYKGVDNTSGTPVLVTKANAQGKYTLDLAPGNYTLVVTAEGYSRGVSNVIIISDRTTSNQDTTLTPKLKDGEIRVVLTWGQYPRDLDSHLVGPTPDGGKFHTYFESKNSHYNGTKHVNLDVDDITSYGPETTSVYVGVSGGTYTFYVHDFTNRNSQSCNQMSTSGAIVKVYIAGVETPYVFNAPTEEGTLWTVFSVTDGVLTAINEMGYERNASSVGQ